MKQEKNSIYLDHAAATPLDPMVLAAMQPYLEENFYNPSSLYEAARSVRGEVESMRWEVAQVLGAKKSEIIFTAGGTESVNLALFGVVKALESQALDDQRLAALPSKVVTSAIEHEAVLACIPALEQSGHKVSVVAVQPNGIIEVRRLIEAIDDQTVLVSVMYANNEIGTIQPIAEIAQSIKRIRQDRVKRGVTLPIYFHSDACQAGGLLDLHVGRLGVDLMTLNGSKIYGPKQTGCLYVRTGTPLIPLIYGGGQEHDLRSGTENVAGIVGFATALTLSQSRRDAEAERLTILRDFLYTELKSAITELSLNGHATKRLANNLNITVPGIDGEAAVLYLDRQGIQVSTGSACSTGRTDPSHVLLALGMNRNQAGASLRFSLGRSTKQADMAQLIESLPPIVERLRQLALAS